MQMRALLLLLCCSALSAGQQAAPDKRLVCYYTSWARYRPPLVRFTPQNINPHLCTHIHYFLANTNEQQILGPADHFSDFVLKGYEQVIALKEVNPALKVLLTLGGSNTLQQKSFEEIVTNDEKIKRFMTESIKYIRNYTFDGIDIDWKVPGQRAGHAKLLRALATAFRMESKDSRKEKLLLSTTISANATKLTEDFDVPQISRSVDYINGLMYQFHSGERNVTGHHAPLFATEADDTEFADFTVQTYIDMGGDPTKLNLAVPTFGKTFTLSNPDVHGFGVPVQDIGFAGKLTGGAGALSFTEICEHISMDGWKAIRPFKDSVGPYAVKGDQWVAYDDEFMMRRKGTYVREKGLGGAAVWTLSQDDFRGFCTGRRFPLIEALKMGLFEDGQVTTTTPIPPTTPIYDNAEIFDCSKNGRFPKQDDCKKFYVCTDGRREESTCQEGTNYDAAEGFCSETASCVEMKPPPVTGFQPTPPPATPTSPTVPTTPPPTTSAPITLTPETVPPTTTPASTEPPPTYMVPWPRISMVPPPPTGSNNAIVIPAVVPALNQAETKLEIEMAVKDDRQLHDVLWLIQGLGGVDSVRRLLDTLGKPQRTSPTKPVPGIAQVVTTDEGKTKIRVHVTVEVEPF